jgi:hypothetical protein
MAYLPVTRPAEARLPHSPSLASIIAALLCRFPQPPPQNRRRASGSIVGQRSAPVEPNATHIPVDGLASRKYKTDIRFRFGEKC